VTRPVRALAAAARRIGAGEYGPSIEVARADELGELATAFNSMARGIADREARIRAQAYHDSLTELPNREFLQELLAQSLLMARRQRQPLAVLILDLDRFREINDTLGHDVGDQVLRQVGTRLRAALRTSDVVARLGADEFAVILPTITDNHFAVTVVERLRDALRMPVRIADHALDVGASVGIALYPDHGDDAKTLIQRAEVAMYLAKRSAASYTLYSPELDQHSVRRLALVGELRRAIEHDELALHYQPKIDLRLARAVGVEALVRWTHAEYGVVSADELVALAEQTGLIRPLTQWVLQKALAQGAEWQRGGIDLAVAVNLSARVLQDPRLPDQVAEQLTTLGMAPERLVLEITESAIMADPECALGIVTRLDAAGVRLSIDDFGTGYSSLAYLRRLPVEELKIDKSFVVSMDRNANDVVIVRSIIDLAHNLGVSVTAEGVENPTVLEMLKGLSCDLAQGYYLSHPLPVPAFDQWLRASPWGLPLASTADPGRA
jgi:diguanylate cyclase (GGDEF)-like protein